MSVLLATAVMLLFTLWFSKVPRMLSDSDELLPGSRLLLVLAGVGSSHRVHLFEDRCVLHPILAIFALPVQDAMRSLC